MTNVVTDGALSIGVAFRSVLSENLMCLDTYQMKLEFYNGCDTIKIYLIEEYDSFCEYSSILCAFKDKAQAEERKRILEGLVEEVERDIEKCNNCPLNLEEFDDEKQAANYQCDRKDFVKLDDGYFYCNGSSKIQYDVYHSYHIKETELE